jgi:hypothetical protein
MRTEDGNAADDDKATESGPNSRMAYVLRSLIEPWEVPLFCGGGVDDRDAFETHWQDESKQETAQGAYI